MCGVSRSEAPRQPKSCTPRSSKRITIAFGLPEAAFNVAGAWVEAKAPASRDRREICTGPVYCNQSHQSAKLTFRITANRINDPGYFQNSDQIESHFIIFQ